jgi:hypothetical protein
METEGGKKKTKEDSHKGKSFDEFVKKVARPMTKEDLKKMRESAGKKSKQNND